MTHDPRADGSVITRFECEETFGAFNAASDWCEDNEISVGTMERHAPIGLLHGIGRYIGKWSKEPLKESFDGKMTSHNFRTGPVFVDMKRKP